MPNESNDTHRQPYTNPVTLNNFHQTGDGYFTKSDFGGKKQYKITLDSEQFMKCTPGPVVPIQFNSRRPQDFHTTRGVVRTKYSSNKRD